MFPWLEQLPVFLLVLVRMTSFFVSAPIFGLKGVPTQFKIGFGFFVSLFAYSTISVDQPIDLDFAYLLMLLKEIIVGLALGFVATLILLTIQIAGGFIDFQMGFAIANVVDPQTGAQVPIIGNFKYILAILFLLSVNGHHLLLEGIMRSYAIVPVDALFVNLSHAQMAKFISSMFVQMFITAFQIAIPIVGCLFLVDVALGMLARTVPQLNIFVVGLPLKIIVGFVAIIITFPVFFYILQKILSQMINTMGQLLQLLGG